MSIWTGKHGYNSIKEFHDRTETELAAQDSELFRKDTQPPEEEIRWLQDQLAVEFTAEKLAQPKLLEVGSGLGAWVPHVRVMGYMYTGVEPVFRRYDYCVQKYMSDKSTSAVWFYNQDARNFKLGLRYEVILFVTVLQHMPLRDTVTSLQNAAKHLALGGKILMIESLILDVTEAEAERMYASKHTSQHMIPKPRSILEEAVPDLLWQKVGGDRYVLSFRHD